MTERPNKVRNGPLDEKLSIVVVIEYASLADIIIINYILMYWSDLERRQDRGILK